MVQSRCLFGVVLRKTHTIPGTAHTGGEELMKILHCSLAAPEVRRLLVDALPEHEAIACAPAEVAAHIADVDIVTPFMTRIDAALLERSKAGLVQQIGVGLEGVDIEAATRLGIWVARVPSVGSGNAESVAEHAILLMLALSRRLPQARHALDEQRWFEPRGQALQGKHACIVGLGGIGAAVAVRLRAFGMHLTAVRERPEQGAPPETGITHVYGPADMHTVLGACDYVVLCVRYEPRNHHMIDGGALRAMKPGAFLVNVARGGLVDPAALLEALHSGHLAGAGLDVFWEEPVDPQHPVLQQPNVIATPHLAGVTDLFYAGATRIYAENIRRYARGEMPLYTANTPPRPRQATGT
jgi:phosphoglycerate dehydrogenase-like enzyme